MHWQIERIETHDFTRSLAQERGATTLLALSEGAGSYGAAQAAQQVLESLQHQRLFPEMVVDPDFWERMLSTMDNMLFANDDCGECAFVVLAISAGQVCGASVGDCGAWMLIKDESFELTASQNLKPRLGTGEALPVGFGPFPLGEGFILASHSLARRVPIEGILAAIEKSNVQQAISELQKLAAARHGYEQLRLAALLALQA